MENTFCDFWLATFLAREEKERLDKVVVLLR